MRESVPIARYSPVCNVLRQWKTSLILTYRVYRLYDIYICGEESVLKLHGADTFLYSTAVKCIKKNEIHMSWKWYIIIILFPMLTLQGVNIININNTNNKHFYYE